MNKNYSILINSTDSYEDCWNPFFKLFDFYWPNVSNSVYLNTEEKRFEYPNLEVKCTQIGYKKNNKRYTWSESLILALNQIETPLVLLILDDLFIDKPVDFSKIDLIAKNMIENNHAVVYLTDQSTSGPFSEKQALLWKLDQKASYRVSALIALWNIEKLKKYIRKHENPWQFEIFGTKRAQLINDSFYSVNIEKYKREGMPIISHCNPTGITRGMWNKEAVIDLFEKHNLKMDFSKRGFYQSKSRTLREKIQNNLNYNLQITRLKSIYDLQKLKMQNGK
jgi:hypothetical protein